MPRPPRVSIDQRIERNRQNNPYYLANERIKRAGVVQEWTEEELQEYQKCMEDPLYFIENYVTINNLDRGLIKFKLYDYQKELINKFHENRFNVCLSSRQSGKCQGKDTIITIRNKKTGIIEKITAGDFHERLKNLQNLSTTTTS